MENIIQPTIQYISSLSTIYIIIDLTLEDNTRDGDGDGDDVSTVDGNTFNNDEGRTFDKPIVIDD